MTDATSAYLSQADLIEFLGKRSTEQAAEIERLRAALRCEAKSGTCVMVHDPERPPCTPDNCATMRAVEQTSRQDKNEREMAEARSAEQAEATMQGNELKAAVLKYAPSGFDEHDDMTVQFAVQLVEKDAEIARLRNIPSKLRAQATAIAAADSVMSGYAKGGYLQALQEVEDEQRRAPGQTP